jgi:hypothetical protein
MPTSGTVALTLPAGDISQHLSVKESRYLRETETKLSAVRAARESAMKKREKLLRKIAALPEAQQLEKLGVQLRQLKSAEHDLAVKVEGIYEQALVDVDGDTLIDKINNKLSGK